MVDFTDRPSHIGPDGEQIPLEEHLDDVRERVGWLVPDDAETPEGNSLSELAEVVTRVHDFGKLTAWFREHLLSDDAQPTGPKHHAPISALLAHYALEARGFDGADQLVGFLAVARHHGRLPDTADYVHRASVEQSGRIQTLYRSDALEQAAHIDETVPELAEALVDRATGGAGDWETFHERLADSDAAIELPWVAEAVCSGRRLRPAPEKLPPSFYESVLQVWSALVFADKASATYLSTGIEIGRKAYRSPTPGRLEIDAYIDELQTENAETELDPRTEQMNERREDARQEVHARAKEFVDDDRNVATLTLPTGMGKTLTGLDAALTVLEGSEMASNPNEGVLSMHCRTRPLSIRWLNRAANCSGPVREANGSPSTTTLRIPSSRRRTSPNQSPTTPSRTSPPSSALAVGDGRDDIRPGVRESGRADKRPLDEAPRCCTGAW